MNLRMLWMHDLSAHADACLTPLLWLAKRSDAEVVVAHALGAPMEPDLGAADTVLATRRVEAEAMLGRVLEQLQAEGVPATMVVAVGQPLDLAERLVERDQVGLVVLGSTGIGGIDRMLLGSTAERLTRHLHVSVLVVRQPFERIRRVLGAVDVHKVFPEVILQAAALARLGGATLDFITVVEPTLDLSGNAPAEARLLRALDEVLGPDRDPGWSALAVSAESPTQGILHRAPDYDLVVCGTEGRRGLRRLLLGSVAESVVRACPVSVLVAR